jgi:hypothetical protein
MRRFKTNADIDMDDDDIEFIVQQVHTRQYLLFVVLSGIFSAQ